MNPEFPSTRWSLIVKASQGSGPESQAALEILCRSYWFPLYAFARSLGLCREDAEDLTQGFFAHLLGGGSLAGLRRTGKFRSFLRVAFKNFQRQHWEKMRAQKRGGGYAIVPLDFADAETRLEGATFAESPDLLFDRSWALSVMDQATRLLQQAYEDKGRGSEFSSLRGLFSSDGLGAKYGEVAKQLGMTEGALKMEIGRLRRAYRAKLHDVIRDTVTTEREVEEELRYLVRVAAKYSR